MDTAYFSSCGCKPDSSARYARVRFATGTGVDTALDDCDERLEQYFFANEIGSLAAGVDDTAEARESAQRKKVATFLTLVGPEANRLLKSLLSPAIPASKTFPELIEVLGNHLKPKKLIVAERFRFHQRNQSEGETVAQFEASEPRVIHGRETD